MIYFVKRSLEKSTRCYISCGCSILSLALLLQIPKVTSSILFTEHHDYRIGYSIGYLFAFIIEAGIVFILFKFGIKWLKGKTPVPATTLDEEFKTE